MVDYDAYFKPARDDSELSYYDEVDITDFKYYPDAQAFTYPCPCGDLFIISLRDLENGETIATCPSCSLIVLVVYEQKDIAARVAESQS
ncbi:diphthamide biosynthesis protein 3 [Pancytospora philotis]|nr:diphthamide biosynthesis protein 3 [Pancytospora philotis]